MLELRNIYFSITKDGEELDLLHDIALNLPRGHFTAIVGPSGCGKSTLLKTIAGLNIESAGEIHWMKRNLLEDGDLLPNEFGYVPQFSIAYEQLTVDESVDSASRLRVRAWGREARDAIVDRALDQAGLTDIADRRVSVLSGGQKRRLGLAMELVANPPLLLCDEVTSGLDPKSEDEIVHLLADLAHNQNRTVVNVTHSLANLQLYDSIIVLYAGCLAYHGPPSAMPHYFSVEHAEDVYPALGKRSPEQWHSSWSKHRRFYYDKLGLELPKKPSEAHDHDALPEEDKIEEEGGELQEDDTTTLIAKPVAIEELETENVEEKSEDVDITSTEELSTDAAQEVDDEADLEDDDESEDSGQTIQEVARRPGVLAQFILLLSRRYKIFFRDRTQLILHLAILIGFPALVAIFTIDGIDPLLRPSQLTGSAYQQIQENIDVRESRMISGSFVSGLIMFQIVLLTLMGANNSAREVAGERNIPEKEKLGGLRPSAYLASKIVFLSMMVIVQSLWMAAFVEFFWNLPGSIESHAILLLLVNGAMTGICLGISAMMRSADQANLLSIYLVGFQLPLSGAILALPKLFEPIIRPFISAYWSWSGSVSALDSDYGQAVRTVSETGISPNQLCVIMLSIHIAAGLVIAMFGLRKTMWQA